MLFMFALTRPLCENSRSSVNTYSEATLCQLVLDEPDAPHHTLGSSVWRHDPPPQQPMNHMNQMSQPLSNILGQNMTQNNLMTNHVNQMGQNMNQMGQNVNQMGQNVNQMGQNVNQMSQSVNQFMQNNQLGFQNNHGQMMHQNQMMQNQMMNNMSSNPNQMGPNHMAQNMNHIGHNVNQIVQNSLSQNVNQMGQNVQMSQNVNQNANQMGQSVNQMGQNVNQMGQNVNQMGQNMMNGGQFPMNHNSFHNANHHPMLNRTQQFVNQNMMGARNGFTNNTRVRGTHDATGEAVAYQHTDATAQHGDTLYPRLLLHGKSWTPYIIHNLLHVWQRNGPEENNRSGGGWRGAATAEEFQGSQRRQHHQPGRALALESSQEDETNLFLRNIESVQRKKQDSPKSEPVDKRQVVSLALPQRPAPVKNLLDEDRDDLMSRMFLGLLHSDRLAQMLTVRKGRSLIVRFVSRVPATHQRLRGVWSRVLRGLPAAARKYDLASMAPLCIYFASAYVRTVSRVPATHPRLRGVWSRVLRGLPTAARKYDLASMAPLCIYFASRDAGHDGGGDGQRAAMVQVSQDPGARTQEHHTERRAPSQAAARAQANLPSQADRLKRHDRDPAER
ncbi:Uncharacterized protein OBRU01_02495 [Operophtera brumata]|uniref:Uncharacterized protein n=1 Tax=Operophtera brumata TaxID=104452 RepID=A0A0L7LRP2_OPEBR|nr:Uncharacterized protein OBRU01_02495 [Operophtera brumata]